ncbi:MAG: penicillin-binding protein 1C, partial [Burkholderiales bacterium PBB5]
SQAYTVGVWVGNASGAPMHDVSGVSGAAPIWRQLVMQLHAGQPSKAPVAPAGVVLAKVAFDGGREPPRDEVFLAGTHQALQRTGSLSAADARGFGIDNPRDGSLYALDPDIPPKAQRITFSGQAGTWWLDGKSLGQGSSVSWAPWPGRHELKLATTGGRVLQTVRFEVRGATLARPAPGHPRPSTR